MNPSAEHPGRADDTPRALHRRRDAIAGLLHQGARTAFARADEEGPSSPLHSLALGLHLAHSQAQLLLLENDHLDLEMDADVDGGLVFDVDAVDGHTVLQLLSEVEQLSRSLPLWRDDMVGGAQWLVDLGELTREAQHRGC